MQTVMRRNSVYIAFILGGALLGERVSFSFPVHQDDILKQDQITKSQLKFGIDQI